MSLKKQNEPHPVKPEARPQQSMVDLNRTYAILVELAHHIMRRRNPVGHVQQTTWLSPIMPCLTRLAWLLGTSVTEVSNRLDSRW